MTRRANKNITCCLDDMCNYVKTIFNDPSDKKPTEMKPKRVEYLASDGQLRHQIHLNNYNNFERNLQDIPKLDGKFDYHLFSSMFN